MDSLTKSHFENLDAKDKNLQLEAFQYIIEATKEEVDWAYDVWEQLKAWLSDPDNHRRARAGQFLAGLAISDPDKRMLRDFPALWEVTKDPKFVTARHTLQSIWKVGLVDGEQRNMLLEFIVDRFKTGADEKHYTLIRYDIIVGLKKLYDEVKDEHIKATAMELIKFEEDHKYRKKYMAAWK